MDLSTALTKKARSKGTTRRASLRQLKLALAAKYFEVPGVLYVSRQRPWTTRKVSTRETGRFRGGKPFFCHERKMNAHGARKALKTMIKISGNTVRLSQQTKIKGY
jgi:hypothetical protein